MGFLITEDGLAHQMTESLDYHQYQIPKLNIKQEKYSLRSELLVLEMDVSRTNIRLDTSIFATSNSERRE